MNNLIYYPSFEIRDQNWLKFALLYLKGVNLIIPETGERFLSSEFWEIYNSTDLFRFYRPDGREGYDASLDAIETIEPILRNPQYYSRRFYLGNTSETIIDKWQNDKNQTFELFEEKYSHEFLHFCTTNGFAHHSRNGIFLPKELSLIFMSLLSKSIGDSKDLSPITDIGKYDYITNLLVQPNQDEDKVTFARNVIDVKLPKNINRFSIDELLKLRTSESYDENLNAFHNAINNFHSSIETGNITQEFLSIYDSPFRAITEEVKFLTLELTSYGFGTYMILSNENIEIPNFIKDIIVGGLIIYTGRRIKVKQIWGNTKNRILVRRYLTGIRRYATQSSRLPRQ